MCGGNISRSHAHEQRRQEGRHPERGEVVEPFVGPAAGDRGVQPDGRHPADGRRDRPEQAHRECHHGQRCAHDPREGLDRKPLAPECDEDQQGDERGGMPFIGVCHPYARGGHAHQEQGLQSPQLTLAEFPCAHCRLCCP